MKHLNLTFAFLALTVLSCWADGQTVNPSQYVTDVNKRNMITSLYDLDSSRVYLMNYDVDYRLDEVLQAQAATMDSATKVLQKLLFDTKSKSQKSLEFGTGCSAYAAKLSHNGQFIMGRNYDFCHKVGDKEVPTTALIVITNPKQGKKSINFVDAYWLGFQNGFYKDGKTDLSALMMAPYIICDGMNEDGLAVSVLYLDGAAADQNEKGKPNIHCTIAMRALLDRCGTVDSAISFFKEYNMHMATVAGGNLHFLIADSLGKHAILEWSYENPVNVDSTTVPSVFMALQADTNRYVTNFYNDPRLSNCMFGGLSEHGRNRYNILRDTLQTYNYILSNQQSKNLLSAVSQSPNPAQLTSHTQWSNVYNLSEKSVECAILQDYKRWFKISLKEEKTELKQVQEKPVGGKKVMIDGVIYIQKNGQLYNLLGEKVNQN